MHLIKHYTALVYKTYTAWELCNAEKNNQMEIPLADKYFQMRGQKKASLKTFEWQLKYNKKISKTLHKSFYTQSTSPLPTWHHEALCASWELKFTRHRFACFIHIGCQCSEIGTIRTSTISCPPQSASSERLSEEYLYVHRGLKSIKLFKLLIKRLLNKYQKGRSFREAAAEWSSDLLLTDFCFFCTIWDQKQILRNENLLKRVVLWSTALDFSLLFHF